MPNHAQEKGLTNPKDDSVRATENDALYTLSNRFDVVLQDHDASSALPRPVDYIHIAHKISRHLLF